MKNLCQNKEKVKKSKLNFLNIYSCKKENIDKIFICIKNSGLFLILLLLCIFIFTTFFFFFHIEITKYHFPIFLCIASFIFYIFNRKKLNIKQIIFPIFIAIFVLISSIFINQNYLDLSWDGNSYHKDAVGLLKNGWNPIYDDYLDTYKQLNNRNMDYIGDEIQTTHGFWQTNYAKGTWVIAANIYACTGNIESGKAYNFILLYITFALILYILYSKSKNAFLSIICSIVIALNPILLTQLFTFYNDGFMGNLLILIIFFMTLFVKESKIYTKKEIYFCLASFLILIINTKFTGFGYAGIFCFFYYLIYVIRKCKNKQLNVLIKPTGIFIFAVVAAVVIGGFSPYVKNTIEHRQIFYPLQGENKVDIVTYNQHKSFQNKSTIYKAVTSIFGQTTNISYHAKEKIYRKVPFKVYKKELESLKFCDIRISGFGVLFSGILIISVLLCIIYIYKFYKEKKDWLIVLIPLFVSGILMLTISESWWARYTPYLYFFPIFAILFLLFDKGKLKKGFLMFLLFLLLINTGFFIKYNTVRNYYASITIEQNIKKLNKNKEIVLVDSNNEFLGMMYNFEDKGLNFKVVTKPSKEDKPLYRWIKYRYEGDVLK